MQPAAKIRIGEINALLFDRDLLDELKVFLLAGGEIIYRCSNISLLKGKLLKSISPQVIYIYIQITYVTLLGLSSSVFSYFAKIKMLKDEENAPNKSEENIYLMKQHVQSFSTNVKSFFGIRQNPHNQSNINTQQNHQLKPAILTKQTDLENQENASKIAEKYDRNEVHLENDIFNNDDTKEELVIIGNNSFLIPSIEVHNSNNLLALNVNDYIHYERSSSPFPTLLEDFDDDAENLPLVSEEEVHYLRFRSQFRLKTAWEKICDKYGRNYDDEADEIDIFSGKVRKFEF